MHGFERDGRRSQHQRRMALARTLEHGARVSERLRGCNARRAINGASETGLNKASEERMRPVRLALKFRVILAGEKVRVIA